MESLYEVAVEEIASAKNQVEKEMLLQKYGIIEPRLTENEKIASEFNLVLRQDSELIFLAPKEEYYERPIL